jgi:phosphodiesterase/alkaline phosphatase D-like protein
MTPQTIRWRVLAAVILVVPVLIATVATAGLVSTSRAAKLPLPEARTGEAGGVDGSEAELFGYLKPTGRSASYRFQWGRTRSYGHVDPRYAEEFFTPSETAYEVEEIVECLRPHTTYHYRLVAYSSSALAYGKDRTLKTTGLDEPRSSAYRYCPDHKPVH